MSASAIDLAIVGGGLAGGLTALPKGDALLGSFEAKRWTGGNEVRFPRHKRRLSADYRSLDSRDFDAGLRRCLPQSALHLNARVTALAPDKVTLADGRSIAARRILDCRDAAPSPHLTGGWQVFLGQHRRMDAPHGVTRPVIMDATVDQIGGYRFLYLLPLSETDLFLEDTYYQDRAELDAPALRERIESYCAERGWQGDLVHEETGLLPVITGGDFDAHREALEQPGIALAGARGGFVHPLTSYTVPIAVRTALAVADAVGGMDGPDLAGFVAARARDHWRSTGYYRLLGKMLFDAAEAARAAGFTVETVGRGGLAPVVASLAGRNLDLMRLCGEARIALDVPAGIAVTDVIVYRVRHLPIAPALAEQMRTGGVVVLHSAELAGHFASECDRLGLDRSSFEPVLIGPRLVPMIGTGWRAVHIAERPEDAALLALAAQVCSKAG